MDGNIQKYQAFVEAVTCGSITRAAENLHYSQSGVSRMIQDLETEWHVTLLERSKGGVKPTSDGVKILPYAKRVCEEFLRLQMQVDGLSGLQAGLIRIGAFSDAAVCWLPEWAERFHADYPDIDFELLTGEQSEIEEWIVSGRVDFGILDLPTLPELETVFLEQDPLYAVLPENHPEAGNPVYPVAGFCDEDFLLLEKENRAEASEIFQRCGLKAKICFTTWDEQVILRMVERGLGVSILPGLALRHSSCRVKALRLDVPAYRNLGIALRSKKGASLAVKRFLDMIST